MILPATKPNMDYRQISLLEILRFIKTSWKIIAITGLAGIGTSIAYLILTPNNYEANAHITMAQIGLNNNNNKNSNNNINPLGINIEEPALLIARMNSPTSFTPQVIADCGFHNQLNAALALSKSIKLTAPKGVANVVELKTFGPSPRAAKDCALAVFEYIKNTQAQIVAPYIEEAQIKLDDDGRRLIKAKEFLAKFDKSGLSVTAGYLSTRDEIHYLLDEISALQNVISSNQNRTTRLIAPIYAGDKPISPKKQVALFVGLFCGLILGLLIAVIRIIKANIKNYVDRLR